MPEVLRTVGESQDAGAGDPPQKPIDINRVRAGLRLTTAISALLSKEAHQPLVNPGNQLPEVMGSTLSPSDPPVLRLLPNPES